MKTQMSQRENASRVPDGKPGMSGRPSLGEILQSRREGVLGWPAPLQWNGGKDGRASLPELFSVGDGGGVAAQAFFRGRGDAGKGDLPDGMKARHAMPGAVVRQCKAVGGSSVVQMAGGQLELGFDVKTMAELEGVDATDRVYWPTNKKDLHWEGEPCVDFAMRWGYTNKDGSVGWGRRFYPPPLFGAIVRQINAAYEGLEALGPLNNNQNKTLIAIRAFRSDDGSMAAETLKELEWVLGIMKGMEWNLFWKDFIDFGDSLQSIEADPSEAHPNTLPTAKVAFGTKTFYFKGRSGLVEKALVGGRDSVAGRISSLGSPTYVAGTHGFFCGDKVHLAEAVTREEAKPMGMESVVSAWMSGIKAAVLACVTGSSDLHEHNIVMAKSGVVHLIDGEFLLDVSLWKNYENSITSRSFYNIEQFFIKALTHLPILAGYLPAKQWERAKRKILEEFDRMNLSQEGWLDEALGFVDGLLESEVLLRIMPKGTNFWLNNLTTYNNDPGVYSFDQDWAGILVGFKDCIDMEEGRKEYVCAELRQNYKKGMVPLFHVGTVSGDLYLNKGEVIGHVKEGRTVADFLKFLKTNFAAAVKDGRVRKLIEDELGRMVPAASEKMGETMRRLLGRFCSCLRSPKRKMATG